MTVLQEKCVCLNYKQNKHKGPLKSLALSSKLVRMGHEEISMTVYCLCSLQSQEIKSENSNRVE